MAAAKTKKERHTGAQPAPRPAGKLGIMVELLGRPEGATVGQLVEAIGWLPHSIRGAMAGSSRIHMAWRSRPRRRVEAAAANWVRVLSSGAARQRNQIRGQLVVYSGGETSTCAES